MGNRITREPVHQKTDPSSSYVLKTGTDAEEELAQEIPLVHSQPVHTVCAADSTHLVTSSDRCSVLVYQWTCHTIKQTFKLPSKPATKIVYNSCNQVIYVASRDGGIYGWRWPIADSTECDCVNISMTDHTLPVTGIATNNDLLVSGSRDNSVKVWDLEAQSCISSVHIPRNLVTDMAWIAEEPCVLQSSEDKTLRVWDTRTCSMVQQLPPKQHIQLCCSASECGNYFVSGSSGHMSGSEVTLWDRRKFCSDSNGHPAGSGYPVSGFVREYRGHTSSVNSCMFLSPGNENMLVSSSNDSTVRVWSRDKEGASMISEYVSGAGPISDLTSPTSSLVACSTFHKGVYVWSVQKSQNEEDYQFHLRAKY